MIDARPAYDELKQDFRFGLRLTRQCYVNYPEVFGAGARLGHSVTTGPEAASRTACGESRAHPRARGELQRRVRAATSTQRQALRARIILACGPGGTATEIAKSCTTHPRTVERWRARFVRHGLDGLEDRPRPGHKPKFDSVTRLQLIALACEPVQSKGGMSRRTIEQLREETISYGIVKDISWNTHFGVDHDVGRTYGLGVGNVHLEAPIGLTIGVGYRF